MRAFLADYGVALSVVVWAALSFILHVPGKCSEATPSTGSNTAVSNDLALEAGIAGASRIATVACSSAGLLFPMDCVPAGLPVRVTTPSFIKVWVRNATKRCSGVITEGDILYINRNKEQQHL
jgi:hypothetical protein